MAFRFFSFSVDRVVLGPLPSLISAAFVGQFLLAATGFDLVSPRFLEGFI